MLFMMKFIRNGQKLHQYVYIKRITNGDRIRRWVFDKKGINTVKDTKWVQNFVGICRYKVFLPILYHQDFVEILSDKIYRNGYNQVFDQVFGYRKRSGFCQKGLLGELLFNQQILLPKTIGTIEYNPAKSCKKEHLLPPGSLPAYDFQKDFVRFCRKFVGNFVGRETLTKFDKLCRIQIFGPTLCL